MLAALKSKPFVERALLAAALASATLLAGAHVFEALGYAPCALCLDQREAHWTGLTLSAAGFAAGAVFGWRRAAIAAAGAAALVYLFSAGLAFYHTGVENHYWPGPATCSGGGPVDPGEAGLGAVLDSKPTGPSCTDAAWRFLGVSMAGYNLFASAGLFALLFFAALNATRDQRRLMREGAKAAK